MGKVFLLDCTLRDGGYINNWEFGLEGIKAIINKLEETNIEMIEIGFLKGDNYNPNRTIFPDIKSFENVIQSKKEEITYVGMLDMSDPIPLDRIRVNDNKSIDGIRVIFKKDKIEEAYDVCEYIKRLGYKLFVNFVNTDAYSDKEFIEGLEKFSTLNPDGVTIVDTFGVLKRKQIKRLVAIADNNLDDNVMLCYHAHNNLQQAFSNSEAIVEMNLKRNIVIDACVFGMGRGAGNLNLELFAEYMNDYYGKNYNISPMLEIMDEYLNVFYKTRFWGYSLPLYLSATHGCHPNYAIYLAEKNTLSEKAFNELLNAIKPEDKLVFNKEKAETYYKKYMEKLYDDTKDLELLSTELFGKTILLIMPGKSIAEYSDIIRKKCTDNTVVVEVNFYDESFNPNYVFAGNSRRFDKIIRENKNKTIATSNIPEFNKADYGVNFSSYVGDNNEIYHNSGLMAIRLFERIGISEIMIAGMDGYLDKDFNYFENGFEAYRMTEEKNKNDLISKELDKISKRIHILFITPTHYPVDKISHLECDIKEKNND